MTSQITVLFRTMVPKSSPKSRVPPPPYLTASFSESLGDSVPSFPSIRSVLWGDSRRFVVVNFPRQTSFCGRFIGSLPYLVDDCAHSSRSPATAGLVDVTSYCTMSSTPISSSSFQPIFDAALSDYAKKTGIDLATHPFAQTLQNCQSADAILDLLQDRAREFSTYRDGNRKLIDCLKPVVQTLHTFSGLLAGAAALVSPRVSNTFNPTRDPTFLTPSINVFPSSCHFHLQIQSWLASMFSLPYVSSRPLFKYTLVSSRHLRRLSESVQVMTLSSTCSNVLGTSSIAYGFTPRSLSPLQ